VSIHDRVRAKIEAGVPCHAQATINGQLVSMHPGITGFDMTFSGNLWCGGRSRAGTGWAMPRG
jgi:hypothetical protein